MYFLRVANVVEIIISIVYLSFLLLYDSEDGPWTIRSVAIILMGILMGFLQNILILCDSSLTLLSYTQAFVFFLTAAYSAFLFDSIFFMRKRVEKSYDIYLAKFYLENAGVVYDDFKQLSYSEQVNILRNTPYDDGMLVEDEDDLETFRCIMKEELKQ